LSPDPYFPVFCFLGVQSVDTLVEIEAEADFPRWSRSHFQSEFELEISKVFGLRAAGQLVGFCVTHIIGDESHILNIVIRRDFRSKGLGRSFLEQIFTDLHKRGVRWVTLEVRPSNRAARSLYRSFGFLEVSTRPGYYKDTGEDALVLKLMIE